VLEAVELLEPVTRRSDKNQIDHAVLGRSSSKYCMTNCRVASEAIVRVNLCMIDFRI